MTWNEEHCLFYQTIGFAITQWAHVEHNVAALISGCVQGVLPIGVTAGFYAIEAFRSKLAFASEFIEANVKDPALLADWQAARDRVARLATQRNRLVHYTVVQWGENNPGRRLSLMPWPLKFDDQQGRTSADGALYIVDIEQIRRNFGAINLVLLNLSRRMWGQSPEPELLEKPKSLAEMLEQLRSIIR
jgi:hypothetical protein